MRLFLGPSQCKTTLVTFPFTKVGHLDGTERFIGGTYQTKKIKKGLCFRPMVSAYVLGLCKVIAQ